MIDLDREKLIRLYNMLHEFSLQISDTIGIRVKLRITQIEDAPVRNLEEEDQFIEDVIYQICEIYAITKAKLLGKCREQPLPDARGMGYKLVKDKFPNCPYKKIGLLFGGRDHSSVMSTKTAFENHLETEPKLQKQFEELKTQLHLMNYQTLNQNHNDTN